MEPVDLDSLHKRYSEKLEEAWKSAKLITFFDMPDDPPDCCSRDSSGEYNHRNPDCPTNRYLEDPDYTTCPFKEIDRCSDQIHWIKTAPFLSCYFRNPAAAKSQNILDGSSNYGFTYRYR